MLGSGAESILHGLISGAAVTLLLRLRPRESPGLRLALLTVGIAWPALLTPLLRGFCPGRLAPPFRDGPALLSGSHFAMLQPAGGWVLATLAGLGTLLFLRDLIPFLWDAFRWRRLAEKAVQGPEWQAARAAAQRLGVKAPMVVVVESGQPILLCRGPLRPRIVASANLRQRLAPDELEAAVIHEVSHAARRDPFFGWALMVVRGLCFFNPAVQLLARAAVHELEYRADQTAVNVMGDAGPLIRSLRRIGGLESPGEERLSLWQRVHRNTIEARCQAMRQERQRSRLGRWQIAATALGLAVLFFFVVA